MAKVSVDFSTVEDGGRIRVPEDDYVLKIIDSKLKDSQAGNSMIVWTFEFTEGKYEGRTINSNSVLTPKSLWNLKKLLEAAGGNVPRKLVKLDTSKYHGKLVGATIGDNEYERDGKTRISSEIRDFIDPDAVRKSDNDFDDDTLDSVDDEPFRKKKDKKGKKGKKDKVAEEEPKAKGKKKEKGRKKKDEDDEIEEIDLNAI
jgi:hypothetical protein